MLARAGRPAATMRGHTKRQHRTRDSALYKHHAVAVERTSACGSARHAVPARPGSRSITHRPSLARYGRSRKCIGHIGSRRAGSPAGCWRRGFWCPGAVGLLACRQRRRWVLRVRPGLRATRRLLWRCSPPAARGAAPASSGPGRRRQPPAGSRPRGPAPCRAAAATARPIAAPAPRGAAPTRRQRRQIDRPPRAARRAECALDTNAPARDAQPPALRSLPRRVDLQQPIEVVAAVRAEP